MREVTGNVQVKPFIFRNTRFQAAEVRNSDQQDTVRFKYSINLDQERAGLIDMFENMPQYNGIKMIGGKMDCLQTADLNWNIESLSRVRSSLFRKFGSL